MKLNPIVILVAAIFTGSAFGQPTPDKDAVTQAAPGVTPVAVGFLPPGLNEMKRMADAEVPKAASLPAKPAPVSKVVASIQPDVSTKPKPKTREEIAAAESRKFKPTGKKVISESSSVPREFDADPVFLGPTLLHSYPQAKLEPVVNVRAGEPATIIIGVGVLNRIVTPFFDAVVDTISNVQIKKAGGVIMIATGSTEPVSLIIHEKEAPESAIIVNLLPKADVAARDVKITAAFAKRSAPSRDEDGPEKEAAHPLAVKLKNLMRDMAKGVIPAGYTMENGSGALAPCALPGFETREAQVLTGAMMTIRVYAAKNIADGENELDERGCSSRRQLAAAAWPKLILRKGEKTELFVVEAPVREAAETASRPSVIDQGEIHGN